MSIETQLPQPGADDGDPGPPFQVLGIFGRDYRLSKRIRRHLNVVEAFFIVSLIPCIVAMTFEEDDWWRWGLVALAGLFLRFVLIKVTLVHFGVEGVKVSIPERKRRYASQLDQKGACCPPLVHHCGSGRVHGSVRL